MIYDSKDLSPQEEIKELVTYTEGRGLELFLGYNANSYHIECTNINPKGENLHDFIIHTGYPK